MKIVLFFPFEGTYLRRDLFSSLLGSSALSKGVYCFFYSSLAVSLYVHVHSLSPGLSASPGIDIQNLVKLLQMGTAQEWKVEELLVWFVISYMHLLNVTLIKHFRCISNTRTPLKLSFQKRSSKSAKCAESVALVQVQRWTCSVDGRDEPSGTVHLIRKSSGLNNNCMELASIFK